MEQKWKLHAAALWRERPPAHDSLGDRIANLDRWNYERVTELLEDANRGAILLAQQQAEEAEIDSALDAAIATTRQRTPAQSADGFLRDALVMLADRRYAGDITCGQAVKAIGRALEMVGCIVSCEEFEAGAMAKSEEVPDAT